MRELQLHRIYRHFKGDHYLVEDVANDSETGAQVDNIMEWISDEEADRLKNEAGM